jgi:hypothetical protein
VDGRAALVVEVVVFDVATEEEEDGMLVVFGFVVPAEEELVRRVVDTIAAHSKY